MILTQNNERGKQNSQWLNNLSEWLMRQENYQNFNDKKNINEPNNNMVKQPIFESYLQIQQVQSKQIPIDQLCVVERNDEKSKINMKKRQNTNNQCNYQPQQQKICGLLAKISYVIKNIVVFQKPYRSISQDYPHQPIVALTISEILQNIEEYSQYHEKGNFNYYNTQNHMPLSHYQSNPLESAFSIDEQSSPVPRQSISLFSRMMKPNQLQMKNKTHSNQASKHIVDENILGDSLQSLQKIYSSLLQFMQIISSPSISEQRQLEQIKSFLSFSLKLKSIQSVQKRSKQIDQSPYLSKKQSLQDNEWSSKYITSRKVESKIHKKKLSLFIEDYDLNQIHISNQQSILFKQTMIVYLAILKEVLIKSQRLFCVNQIQLIKNLPSYKSKQTNFCSFPSQNSKSMSSYPSLQFKSKNLTQSKIQSNRQSLLKDSQLEAIIAKQMLVRKISQNKNVLNRKRTVFNNTQWNQDDLFPKISLVQFTNLLYDVWLSQVTNRKKLGKDIQKVSNYDETGFIFSSIYQLIASDEQVLLFLVFVLKQLQYNILWNLRKQKSFNQQINKNQLQNSAKSSDINSRMKQNFMKKSSLNQQIQDQQNRTKRIKAKSAKNKDNQQLQKTRNKYIEQISESMQNSNKSDRLEPSKKQNSSSKLALSRLYQSKLNNIIKKTQKINQQAAKTHLNPNKTTSQNKIQNFIQQNSLINLKSKQLLMRSKNPTDHQQNLHILQLKQHLIQKNTQLQQKQKLIKKLMFMQEINKIDSTVFQKNIENIYMNKIQNIKNQYKQKLKSKQQEIKTTKQNLRQKSSYIQQVKKQRKIQAKLLQESNQIYNLKKWTLPEKDKQLIKAKYSQSLSNLKKGCYKDLYTQRNKQNIQQMSNITQKDQSMSVQKVAEQKVIPSKSLIQPQINCKENILNKLKNLQQKINTKNKSVKHKFLSQS